MTLRARARAALTCLLLTGLLTGGPALADTPPSTPDPVPSDLRQSVGSDEAVADGAKVVLKAGHVDLGPKVVGGAWKLRIRDDSTSPPVWRALDDVVLTVPDAARLTAPSGPEYPFLSGSAGRQVYVVPQTQNPNVIWLGWNTQDPAATTQMDRGATLTMLTRQGPGQMFLFLQNGIAGGPQLLWDSREKRPQNIWVDVNTHTHANWVFTEPGVHLVQVAATATTKEGRTVSDTATLRFAVGSGTSPAAAASATLASPVTHTPAATGDAAAPAPTPARDQQDGSTVTLGVVVVGGVAALIAVLVLVFTLRARRARAAAGLGDRR